jgi:hypothetical protein
MAAEPLKPRRFWLRRILYHQVQEDASGMKSRKYVAMAIVVSGALALAIRLGCYVHSGADPKMTPSVALPFALSVGTAVIVTGLLFIQGSRPCRRLLYCLPFGLLGIGSLLSFLA